MRSRSVPRCPAMLQACCHGMRSERRPSCMSAYGSSAMRLTYESAAAHASRTSSGSHFQAPYGRRDSGVRGIGSHARPSAAFECYAVQERRPDGSISPTRQSVTRKRTADHPRPPRARLG